MASQISDQRRDELAASLALALANIYSDHAQQASVRLGKLGQYVLTPEKRAKIEAFAADRATKVQAGINQRIAAALDALPDDASPDSRRLATGQARNEISDYNQAVLMPYMTAWAAQQSLADVYRDTPDPNGSGQSAMDATLWVWSQSSTWVDDCTSAASASPASYDALVNIAGGEPPVHSRCGCSLDPA